MALETRRIPAFLNGPTAPTAVLLPMRLFAGYWWFASGLEKFRIGWLRSDEHHLPAMLRELDSPSWFGATFIEAADENVFLFQWLIVLSHLIFGAMMIGGAVTRVAGSMLTMMAILGYIATGYASESWFLPMGLMTLTLAISSAGRYLGLDAILRARLVRVPLF